MLADHFRDTWIAGAIAFFLIVNITGCAAPRSPWADLQHDTAHGFQDPLLDRLIGDWVLEGRIAGKDVVHDVTAEWVVGHQYLRFVELSREREDDGARAYEAIVLIGWDAQQDRYACLWLDSTGGSGLVNGLIGYAAPSDDRLVFRYDYEDFNFRTVFIFDRDLDRWRWEMDAVRGEELRPFARLTMTRVH
ncbi:MAG: DUF1579 family protein [Phycisphaeraceae bacterium]|nr:DUF1579 family protein [Phycisphaeraceae bacterium]MCB9848821.1 DUF1579 family protein [Phycisphaeraceae bacterium]